MMNIMTTILNVQNLKKKYGTVEILSNISFTLKKGEITCLLGQSGAGKTTLLRCLALLEDIDSGAIIYDKMQSLTYNSDENLKKKVRNKIGIVFQDFNLWPHKTVMENIVEPLTLIKQLSKQEAIEKASAMLAKVDLTDKADTYPDFLSGGQKQRAAIARTLSLEPSILLLDEITSSLDPELTYGILRLIKQLAHDGQTMLLVTHHLQFANEIADRVLFMNKGRIVEKGYPQEILFQSRRNRTKQFLQATQ